MRLLLSGNYISELYTSNYEQIKLCANAHTHTYTCRQKVTSEIDTSTRKKLSVPTYFGVWHSINIRMMCRGMRSLR